MFRFLNIFRKNKLTVSQQLEQIEEEAGRIEEGRDAAQHFEKRLISGLLLYSSIVFLLAALLLLTVLRPSSSPSSSALSGYLHVAACILLLLSFPLVIYLTKQVVHWWFLRRARDAELRLAELNRQKKRILKSVTEKETFRNATAILARFDPNHSFQNDLLALSSHNNANNNAERGVRAGSVAAGGGGGGTANQNSRTNTTTSTTHTKASTSSQLQKFTTNSNNQVISANQNARRFKQQPLLVSGQSQDARNRSASPQSERLPIRAPGQLTLQQQQQKNRALLHHHNHQQHPQQQQQQQQQQQHDIIANHKLYGSSGSLATTSSTLSANKMRQRHSALPHQHTHAAAAGEGPPRLVRPLLSPHKSRFDWLMDRLVGDGPGNRFALICAACHGHNGMALAEEFPHLTYRCAYCHTLNPAKQPLPTLQPHSSAGTLDGQSASASQSSSASSLTAISAPISIASCNAPTADQPIRVGQRGGGDNDNDGGQSEREERVGGLSDEQVGQDKEATLQIDSEAASELELDNEKDCEIRTRRANTHTHAAR